MKNRYRLAISWLCAGSAVATTAESAAATLYARAWGQFPAARWVGLKFGFPQPYSLYESHCTQGTGPACNNQTPDDCVFRYFSADFPVAPAGATPPYTTYYSYRFGLVKGTFGGSDPFQPAAYTSSTWRLAAQVVGCSAPERPGVPAGDGCSIMAEYQSTASLPVYPLTLRIECTTDPNAVQGEALCVPRWQGISYARMTVDGMSGGAAQFLISHNTGTPAAAWAFAQLSGGLYTRPASRGSFRQIMSFRKVLDSNDEVPAYPSTLTGGEFLCAEGCLGSAYTWNALTGSQAQGILSGVAAGPEGDSFVATGSYPGAYWPREHMGQFGFHAVDTPAASNE